MDGENNGKHYEQMDDLKVPLFLETPIYRCKDANRGSFGFDVTFGGHFFRKKNCPIGMKKNNQNY